MRKSALVFMWIEKPAGAPAVPVPQTWSVMLDVVLLRQLMPGVVRSGFGGGGPAHAAPASTSAPATSANDAIECLCPCRIRPPSPGCGPPQSRRERWRKARHGTGDKKTLRAGRNCRDGGGRGAKELRAGSYALALPCQ